MAYEIRGSMVLYLVLVVTASFTSHARVISLFLLTMYCVYWGDLLGDIPFYTGALLANLSIVLGTTSNNASRGIGIGKFRVKWPLLLAVFALFLGSYPPDSPDARGWSNVMLRFAEIFFPADCTFPTTSLN